MGEMMGQDRPRKMPLDQEDWIKQVPHTEDDESAAVVEKGGPGSGNFGHAGRPGKVGGSGSGSKIMSAKESVYFEFGITDRKTISGLLRADITPDKIRYARNRGIALDDMVGLRTGYTENERAKLSRALDRRGETLSPKVEKELEKLRLSGIPESRVIQYLELGSFGTDITEIAAIDKIISPLDISPGDMRMFEYYDTESDVYFRIDELSLQTPKAAPRGVASVLGGGYDSDGHQVARFTRAITPDGLVVHGFLEVDADRAGRGIGTRYYRRTENNYLKHPALRAIILDADLKVGGYAWARMGYDFAKSQDLTIHRDGIASRYVRRYGSDLDAIHKDAMYDRIHRRVNHSWDIAALEGKDGARIGKDYLLGTDWVGVKYLDKTSPAWKVGNIYYGIKLGGDNGK